MSAPVQDKSRSKVASSSNRAIIRNGPKEENEIMLRYVGRFTAGAVILFCSGVVLPAQDARPTREGQPAGVGAAADPYVVYETNPVILRGPYLLAPTETSVVIVWTTDTPCHSKVLYGVTEPTMEANNARDGML